MEQAQQVLFPGARFLPDNRTLSDEQAKAISNASGVDVRNKQLHVWRVSSGGWFIVDEVVGKHEYIPFAVGLNENGVLKGIEVLEYREAYGSQIREPQCRQQFIGKTAGDPLQLEKPIRNISGATLSCKHITDGVRRLLATWQVVLKNNASH